MRKIKRLMCWQFVLCCVASWLGATTLRQASAQTGPQIEERIPGVPAGYTIIDGDIQMPISVVNAMRQQRLSPGLSPAAPAAPEATFKTNLWPNGIIPFEFETNCEPTSTCANAPNSGCVGLARIAAMLDAMKVIEDVANVDFRQCLNNECSGNHMRFRDSTNDTTVAAGPDNVCQGAAANNSPVGMQGGQQGINIVSWDGAEAKFIIAHELMHTLGMIHEQSRADRDTYVDVATYCGNVRGGCMGTTYLVNFPKVSGTNTYGSYDFDSLMHYGECSFSRNNGTVKDSADVLVAACPAVSPTFPDGGITVSVRVPFKMQWQGLIGQRAHLSDLDRLILSFLYARPDWRFVDPRYAGGNGERDGTFLRPYASLEDGIKGTPSRGTLWLQPGAYGASNLTKQLTFKAPFGGVTFSKHMTVVAETLASVSAASYNGEVAADSIAAAFGANLAAGVVIAATLPLPTTLGGATVKVTDAAGMTRNAPLFFVSPNQINYQIPTGTSVGIASIAVYNSGGTVVASGTTPITPAAPALFAANANAEGVPAALVLRVRGDGLFYEPVARYDGQRYVPLQIDLGPESEQVFLVLYGTGFRSAGAANAMTTIGDAEAEVLYAGAAPGFAGLDQANVRIPRSLIGKGEVSIAFTADNRSANAVTVNIR